MLPPQWLSYLLSSDPASYTKDIGYYDQRGNFVTRERAQKGCLSWLSVGNNPNGFMLFLVLDELVMLAVISAPFIFLQWLLIRLPFFIPLGWTLTITFSYRAIGALQCENLVYPNTMLAVGSILYGSLIMYLAYAAWQLSKCYSGHPGTEGSSIQREQLLSLCTETKFVFICGAILLAAFAVTMIVLNNSSYGRCGSTALMLHIVVAIISAIMLISFAFNQHSKSSAIQRPK
jgi:hypothetical protein